MGVGGMGVRNTERGWLARMAMAMVGGVCATRAARGNSSRKMKPPNVGAEPPRKEKYE